MENDTNFSIRPPSVGGDSVKRDPDRIESPEPPPQSNLSDEQLEIYNYLCTCLRKAGIDHATSGLVLSDIAIYYDGKQKAYRECEEFGYEIISKTGSPYEAPRSIRFRMYIGLLNQMYSKACLTIPSLARVRKDTGEKSGQDDLFSDLVNHATNSPANGLQH